MLGTVDMRVHARKALHNNPHIYIYIYIYIYTPAHIYALIGSPPHALHFRCLICCRCHKRFSELNLWNSSVGFCYYCYVLLLLLLLLLQSPTATALTFKRARFESRRGILLRPSKKEESDGEASTALLPTSVFRL